jgi:hypothetical protein
MNTEKLLEKLQTWYSARCDGDWEHSQRVRISTIDNPGWALDINIEDTDAGSRPFIPVAVDRSGSDWYICRVEGTVFKARGGANNLVDLLSIFLEWVESRPG